MRHLMKVLPAAAVSILLAACGSSYSSGSSSGGGSSGAQSSNAAAGTAGAVKTAANSTLHMTILVDAKGLTLYHLSGEQNGKWICTSSACLSAWHPLTASAAGSVTGSVGSLATVKRPGGGLQVTYKGAPLYTFSGDSKPGDAHGQGLKDVGVWNAATTGASSSKPSSTSPASSSGGGSGY
jgi:predicted lipoprotein with Yx(FWY)xxD motif